MSDFIRLELDLPDQPTITPNSRAHWAERADCARAWRHAVATLGRKANPPRLDRVAVTLTHWPADRRRRDPDSLALVAKWCLDGLVDARVIDDDDSTHVTATTCRIEPTRGDKQRHWTLTVEAT